ncbi:MBL fold metallo-hydrolase [Rhodoferax sp. TBRC 17660]|uniref:MBL fold metallo-hydrolase n=1 Tax=Rhodoferax potami TaxID=3068338 RepID=A0ABU3KPL1_9BURK|nr:MBL fold metallo-hydrolase [Rhodoferax sp. TBRC 17660]MDT7519518.1 MBL fold metallo-hydrolase [Rhodoferax sp. TBRC 17660]
MQRTLSRIALAVGLLAGAIAAPHAMADAPMVKTQAPGFYRMMVGDFEVTAISDGTVKLPMLKLMNNQPAEKIAEALKRGFLKEMVETSVNTYLINTGSKLVLVDTGAAGLFGPTLGNLLANLKAAGYQPEQVDEIYITHMHPDHVGGLMAQGSIAFPNATLRIDKRDVDFWLSDANLAAAPEGNKGFFQGAMASVKPYVAAGKLKPFEGNTELVPGIRAVSTYGHTPGHASYVVESKGEKLMLWGDLMHLAAVQFDDPSATIAFDTDNSAAQQQRAKAFEEAAKGGYMVGVTHVAFPGLGNLRPAANGKGYVWVPLNYSSLK